MRARTLQAVRAALRADQLLQRVPAREVAIEYVDWILKDQRVFKILPKISFHALFLKTIWSLNSPSDQYLLLDRAPCDAYFDFVDHFLQCDGVRFEMIRFDQIESINSSQVFILRMLSNHVGDVTTLEVIRHLWRAYCEREQRRIQVYQSINAEPRHRTKGIDAFIDDSSFKVCAF